MTARKDLKKLDQIGGWLQRLDALANEMDVTEDPALMALAIHIDSITTALDAERAFILRNGPVEMLGKFAKSLTIKPEEDRP